MARDWQFSKTPFWIFTHLFVLSACCLFVWASVWQWGRLQERRDYNAEVVESLSADPMDIADISHNEVKEFEKVSGTVEIIDSDFIRIGGRTFQGSTGTHVVALAQDVEGVYIFLNRGFWPQGDGAPAAIAGSVLVEGYIRETVEQGTFAVDDVLDSDIAPRFNLEALQKRSGAPEGEYQDYWVQIVSIDSLSEYPDDWPALLPEPELSEGSHFSYSLQWLIFALLTVVVYAALLRRKAGSIGSSSSA